MKNPFSFFNRRISGKIILPYLVLVFLLGVLATYVVITLVSTSIFDRFREDLANGGRAANGAMLKIEDQQLASLRQMAFTVGVDDAIVQKDVEALQRLLGPIQVNQRVGYVDVFDASGQQIFALRPADKEAEAVHLVDPNAGRWGPVRRVVEGQVDDLGDKYAALVRTAWGEDVFYTAGPVKKGEATVGVIAVGSPVASVISRLSQDAAMGVSLYDPRTGDLIATSVPGLDDAVAISPAQAATVGEGNVITRRLNLAGDTVVELIGTLTIRREPVTALGMSRTVNFIEDTGSRTRDALIVLFSAVAMVVLMVGLVLARHLTRPIGALVRATERVREGDLDVQVPVMSGDETGVLAREFNTMVEGLRERDKARDAFGRYFSDDFYEMVQNGELALGGEKREITIILSDIRSFTTLSEGLDPVDLVSMLNEYFELQVEAIKRHGGEVDKYMGDAILVKFGAPRWYPDHARRAVLAMLDMRAGLDEFNRRRIARGEAPIRIGIGANTGPAVVGNIGSAARMEYTIIGDTVNATQRIEDLCKELRWDLLISDQTYEAVRDLVEVGSPTSVILRGRQRETLVYPLVGLKPSVAPPGAGSATTQVEPAPEPIREPTPVAATRLAAGDVTQDAGAEAEPLELRGPRRRALPGTS